MQIRGSQIFNTRTRAGFSGWARSALALAMAVFLVAQGAPLPARGAGAGHGVFGQTCERPGAPSPGGESRAPATGAAHDCEACVACVFSSIAEPRADFHLAPVAAKRIALAIRDGSVAPLARWRAAHPARAPPSLS